MKTLQLEVRSSDLDGYPYGVIEGIASTDSVDRENDVIDHSGWDFDDFWKNGGVLLYNHNHDKPIGKVFQLTNQGGKLFYKARLSKTPFAQEVRTLVDEGIISFSSVGFQPLDIESREDDRGMEFKRQKLIEISLAPIPANLEAEIISVRSKQFPEITKSLETKGVVPYESTPFVDRPWDKTPAVKRLRKWASKDGSGDKDKMNWGKYKRGFAYFKEDGKEFGDYMFPHHDISGGRLVCIPAAVRNALARLDNSSVPSADKDRVRSHLERHLNAFNERELIPQEPSEEVETVDERRVLQAALVGAVSRIRAMRFTLHKGGELE